MSGKKILVCDDDRKFLKIIQDALGPRGYEVITAPTGEHAISTFQKFKPDLVMVDVLLPQIDGFQVCEKIRQDEHGKKVPILMMTAVYKSPEREREAKNKYRVKEYLTKPIDLAHLLKVIEQVTA